MVTRFLQIKVILDQAIADWEATHGRPPQLTTHGDSFGWEDREQLLNSVARGYPLIQPELVGADDASTANIVKVLGSGLPFVPRMPIQGPYVSSDDIELLKSWIQEGAPN